MEVILFFACFIGAVLCLNGTIPLQILDEDRNIERPCEIFDTFCIRQYFPSHSQCKQVNRRLPNPLYRARSSGYIPRVNITAIFVDKEYNIGSANIREFYINQKTDKLIMTVEFSEVRGRADTTYFRYHRRGREPVTTMDYFIITFSPFLSTIIIPNLKDLQLDKAEVFTYFNDPLPRFLSIGPKTYVSEDSVFTAAFADVFTNLPVDFQEYFLSEGTFFIANFIQHTLCDFGLFLP